MFNTEIVQSYSARSHSTKVGGMVFRESNNSLIFLDFSLLTQIQVNLLIGTGYVLNLCPEALSQLEIAT